jgi:hypothetical protein
MIVAKQVADFITFSRGLLILFFTWLGIAYGKDGLQNFLPISQLC